MSIRVLLVDDQDDVRAALRRLLERTPDIRVVGEADDGEDALEQIARFGPDVVLLDIRMPRLDGIGVLRRLGRQRASGAVPRVIVLTTFDLDEYVYAALREGASGFLIKNVPPEQLRHAVRVVAEGNALLDPAVTRRVIQHFAREAEAADPRARAFATLTEREREVARLVARGMSNQEIGEALSLSYWTVKTHIKRILGKLDAHERSQIVITVYEAGALDRSRP